VKFTPDRGQIGIRATRTDGHVQVAVWDTGVGIAPADQKRIFDEFQQVGGKGLVGKIEGTGLGLTLTKKFVEMHGGEIWVESLPGQGSTFAFTLPLNRAATWNVDDTVQRSMDEGGSGEDASSGSLVLAIENDPKAASLLRIYLTEAGYRIAVARDGSEGLEKVKRLRPAAVLLDVLLPNVDGWDFLAQVKADPQTREIPVIVVSIVDDKSRGFALGAAEYLVKPIQKDELLGKLRAIWPENASSLSKIM
jgi:CheY-like chemotaxis protein